MSASFGVVGRSQLAGYAGTAGGILRSRIHPLVPIAAIDVLAVAVALGAMNLVGTIVSGQHGNPFLSAIDQTKDDLVTFAVKAPAPVPAVAKAVPAPKKTPIAVLAAMPDAELLFGQPVFIGGPFESGQGDTVRFVAPVDVAVDNTNAPTPGATGEESPPTDVAVIEELPLPTPVVKVVDDVVPLKKNSSAGAGAAVTSTVAPAATKAATPVVQAVVAPVQAVAAPVQSVAAPVVQSVAAPAQQVVQSVAQPVTKVVGGLLN